MQPLLVELNGLSKRYDRDWVIREVSFRFESGHIYGITGRNGAGKSTLVRMIAGHLSPSRGKINYTFGEKSLNAAQIPPLLSYVGPYIDTIEEFTLNEALRFHFSFKPLRPGLSLETLPDRLGLSRAALQTVSSFSSGMKQRLLLGLAIYSHTPLLLLDEPTTTLDLPAQQWFQEQLAQHSNQRLIIIATNVESDLQACTQYLTL